MNQINPSWPTPHNISQTDAWAEPLVSGLNDMTSQANANDSRIGTLESQVASGTGGGGSSGVSSVNSRTGVVTLSKADVGLGNLDNTSDVNKPVSTAQATALAKKVTIPAGGSDGQMIVRDSTVAEGFGYRAPSSGGGTGTSAVSNGDGTITLGVVGTGSVTTNVVTASTYTLSLGDAGNVVEQNSSGLLTITVPTDAAVPIPIGYAVEVTLYGTGSVTFVAAGGVSLLSPGGALRLTTRYASAALRKRSATEWVVSGYTVA